jgi:putative ABC transport system permease protein
MSTTLWVVVGILAFVTSMGIVGLAVFGINCRHQQIRTRRTLGATRFQILRYFLVENLFITGIGVAIGAVSTIGFSIILTTSVNMSTMVWYPTPLGMLALLIIGLLIALDPAASATRTQPASPQGHCRHLPPGLKLHKGLKFTF